MHALDDKPECVDALCESVQGVDLVKVILGMYPFVYVRWTTRFFRGGTGDYVVKNQTTNFTSPRNCNGITRA